MQVTDPISDLLTRIRNGQTAGHDVISVPASKMKIGIAHILKREGFIRAYKCIRDRKQGVLKIALKYDEGGRGVINTLSRISKPSCRIYVNTSKIGTHKNGFGVGILSTSRGLMTDKEAKKNNIGGEYLCKVF